MLIINVVEAEVTQDARGKRHTYIIKDDSMKEVYKYVDELVRKQPDIYDCYHYACYQDQQGEFHFHELTKNQITNTKKIGEDVVE